MIYNVTMRHRNIKGFPTSFRFYMGFIYEGWNFNSGNYLFTTDTK